VCRTVEVRVRAAQVAGPSAPAMAMASPARASSSSRAHLTGCGHRQTRAGAPQLIALAGKLREGRDRRVENLPLLARAQHGAIDDQQSISVAALPVVK
jgi:hypothetical protein